MEKHVKIGRKWNDQLIYHQVVFNDEGVSITCDLQPFMQRILSRVQKLGRIERLRNDIVQKAFVEEMNAAIEDLKQSTTRGA